MGMGVMYIATSKTMLSGKGTWKCQWVGDTTGFAPNKQP